MKIQVTATFDTETGHLTTEGGTLPAHAQRMVLGLAVDALERGLVADAVVQRLAAAQTTQRVILANGR